MAVPSIVLDARRLAALASYGILDTSHEQDFDDVVQLATQLCATPVALISLVDGDRQWFKAQIGFEPRQTDLNSSVCAHALAEPDILVIPDLSLDKRTKDNPLVTGEPRIRFYAGAPLRAPAGEVIGSLCVIDGTPRPQGIDDRQASALRLLSRQVMTLLELRRAVRERDEALSGRRQDEVHHQRVLESATDYAIISLDLQGDVTGWNRGAELIFGWSEAEMLGKPGAVFFTEEDRAAGVPEREMQDAARYGRGSDERYHVRKSGSRFFASGEMMSLNSDDGTQVGYLKILRDRTAEHMARRALEESEARLRQAQEAGGVGLFAVDIADEILHPTPEFCRLFGLPVKQSYPSYAFEERVFPEDAQIVSSPASRASGEPPRDVEYRILRKDTGELRWIARKGAIEFGANGRPVRFVGVARDITRQRAAQEALARSEERYRALFEAIYDGFCVIEFIDGPHGPLSDYIHVEANPGYERQTGIKDIVGKTVRDLAPEEADGWVELYGGVLHTGESIQFERDFIAAGRRIEVSASRIEPASRRQVSVLFRDVTARTTAEAALRASEALTRQNVERVQLALDAGAIIGTWFWDLPTDRFTVDEAFARAFGLDPALGRVGLSLEQVIATVHPDDKAQLEAAINDAITRGGAYAHQYRVRRVDGKYYWIEANGRVDQAPDGTPLRFPGVLINVEERRAVQAERDRATAELRALNETLEQRVAERTDELMRAEEQLRQSQKMEAVGQLTGGLAHDFNNLLAGISGALELMNTRIIQGRLNDVDKYMVAAQGAARRAAALTHRLLAFSRRQTLDPRPTNVNALVSGMTDLIQRTVGPSIPIEAVGASGLWPALVDASQLENALLNLCINARDAMPDGGRITIETANKWLDRQAARAHDVPEGQYLSLCVTDNGTGMTPDVVAKAFDPFFTTKPLGQGTGLGLSMIYGFAKQSGGQVRIYSEVGQGTTVCIYLPRHYGDARTDEDDPDKVPVSFAEAGETVLIVDDEPTLRMLITDILEDLGYRVIEAADSSAGLRLLQSNARIDLLITDVGLPGGMNGRQMADAGREIRPNLKTLFITGYAENAVVGNGHLQPGMQVLTKPFDVDTLAARVRELMALASRN